MLWPGWQPHVQTRLGRSGVQLTMGIVMPERLMDAVEDARNRGLLKEREAAGLIASLARSIVIGNTLPGEQIVLRQEGDHCPSGGRAV